MLVWFPVTLPSIHPPANAPGERAEDGPRIWVPATFLGYQEVAADSWIQPAPRNVNFAVENSRTFWICFKEMPDIYI